VLVAAIAIGVPAAAQAGIVTYIANLSGPNEFPVNTSPGIGFAKIDVDDTGHTLHVMVNFSNLGGVTTAAHIHSPTPAPFSNAAGVATQTPTFSGFPLNVKSGTYDNTFDMTLNSSYNPAYITANGGTPTTAEAALFSSFKTGNAYLNIHTSSFSGGEIRGFLVAIPEPSSFALAATLIGGTAGFVRRRRQSAPV